MLKYCYHKVLPARKHVTAHVLCKIKYQQNIVKICETAALIPICILWLKRFFKKIPLFTEIIRSVLQQFVRIICRLLKISWSFLFQHFYNIFELYIKVVGSNIHTSVYDKRDDFGFPIVNFPWLSGDVPRLPSYGIYISQLVRFARCCTSVFDFHSKNLQITSKLLTQGYRYHKLRKTFGKFFRSYSELLSKFGEISFQDYVSQGIAHPVFYGDLVYKLRRVKGEANFISSGSKIVKRLRRRQYDQAIIERTIGLMLGPCTALYRSFLKRCTLTNKAVRTIWQALSKPHQRRQGPDPRPLWLLVGTPSAFGPELAYRLRVAQPTLMDVTRYFWYTFILLYMFMYYIFMTSPLWLAVGPQST